MVAEQARQHCSALFISTENNGNVVDAVCTVYSARGTPPRLLKCSTWVHAKGLAEKRLKDCSTWSGKHEGCMRPRLVPSMGICWPCYGLWAWSLSNCCERLLGHGFADLDYKTAYGHALGCTKIGSPTWPWEALLLLWAGLRVIERASLLRNEGTHKFLRGERWPQGTPAAAAGDMRQCPGFCPVCWHDISVTALGGSATGFTERGAECPSIPLLLPLCSRTMDLLGSPGSYAVGRVLLTHTTALRHGSVVPHASREGALHGGRGVDDEGAGGGRAQRGQAACAAGIPARCVALKRAECLHAATTGSRLVSEASVLICLPVGGPETPGTSKGRLPSKLVSQLARSPRGRRRLHAATAWAWPWHAYACCIGQSWILNAALRATEAAIAGFQDVSAARVKGIMHLHTWPSSTESGYRFKGRGGDRRLLLLRRRRRLLLLLLRSGALRPGGRARLGRRCAGAGQLLAWHPCNE